MLILSVDFSIFLTVGYFSASGENLSMYIMCQAKTENKFFVFCTENASHTFRPQICKDRCLTTSNILKIGVILSSSGRLFICLKSCLIGRDLVHHKGIFMKAIISPDHLKIRELSKLGA